MGNTVAATAGTWLVYQPLIVGLGAVVLATAGNTLLEWYRQNLHDKREARVIRRAFLEELRAQRTFYAGAMSDDQRATTEGAFMVPIDTFVPVYDHMIGKIGALESSHAAAIIKAYSHIMLTPKNLLLLGRVHRDEFASFVEVPAQFADVLSEMNKVLVNVIDEALEALS